MADYVVRLSGQDNLSSTINKVKTELNDLGSKGQTATEKIDAKFNKIINSTAPLKRQLRDLQQLMAQMNFDGMSNTEQFTRVAQAAGQIKDAMADASEAVRRYSNDTATLQAGIQAFQGLAAVGTVATGVMALFGAENEDAAKAIQKVQGALAILNGVQTVANTLNKDSALMLKLKQIRLVATTAATGANTVATTANTAATTANTIATKAWNVVKAVSKALMGDFSGLVIVGAAALATYAFATSSSSDKQKEMNANVEQGTTFLEKQIDATKEVAKSIDSEKYQIAQLLGVLQNENVAYDDKVKALEKLKGIIPSVNGYIASEGTYHGNAVVEIRKHIAALDDLQKALAAFKLGQKIQEEVTTAKWEKFQANQKVIRKQNNIRADERQMERHQNDGGYTWNGGRSQEYLDAQNRKKINQTNLEAAQVERDNADNRLKAAQRQQQEFKQFQQQNGGSARAQAAVALANGNTQQAVDYFIGRDKITSPKSGGGRGGRSGGGGGHTETQAEKDAKEQAKYMTTIDNLQSQYNDKLITELEYKKKVKEAEESHLKYLFETNRATQADIDRYNAADIDLTQTTIKVNYESNIEDLNTQLQHGFITSEEYAEGIADALKNVYLENLKAGTATKEMADAFKEAQKNAEGIKLDQDLDKLLDTTYSKQESSFEKATKTDEPVTFDTQLNGIEDQMNFNDDLIEQLNTIKQLYEELGLTGTESYDSINAKILEATESNDVLAEQAQEIKEKQTKWADKQKEIEGYSEAIGNLGSTFSSLGGALDESTGQWLNFTGQALDATAKLLPEIMKLITAKNAEAIASGAAEGAKVPFPGNIAAILSIVATIASVFASLPKFASGGIVSGGSTHGDRVLARLNGGEMILDGHQQSNLFKAIENGDFGSSNIETPTINFRLKGSDIYGSLKNFGKGQLKTGKNIGIK